MELLTFKIEINAAPETVWEALFQEENYTKWTTAFHPGSYYKGTLEQDAEIQLLTPEGHGMFSQITVYEPFKELTFLHQGEISNGEKGELIYEDAYESYFLEDLGETTELTVKLNCDDDYIEQMNRMFPDALQRVKELAEEIRK